MQQTAAEAVLAAAGSQALSMQPQRPSPGAHFWWQQVAVVDGHAVALSASSSPPHVTHPAGDSAEAVPAAAAATAATAAAAAAANQRWAIGAHVCVAAG